CLQATMHNSVQMGTNCIIFIMRGSVESLVNKSKAASKMKPKVEYFMPGKRKINIRYKASCKTKHLRISQIHTIKFESDNGIVIHPLPYFFPRGLPTEIYFKSIAVPGNQMEHAVPVRHYKSVVKGCSGLYFFLRKGLIVYEAK